MAMKPAKPAAHPAIAEMIVAAATKLAEKKGSSSIAIKKNILANYKVSEKSVATFVKTDLRRLVEKKTLTQDKGSYKLTKKAERPKAAKKPAAKKATAKKATPKKAVKKTAAKKPAKK